MLQPYKKYNAVEYDYATELPDGWIIKKIKFLCNFQKGIAPKFTYTDCKEGFYPYLALDYLRGEKNLCFYTDKGILIDEYIPLMIWDGANAGETILSKKGFLASTLVALKPKNEITNKYLFYVLKGFEKVLKANTFGTTIPHVEGNFFKNIKIPVPPLEVQNSIVTYLDKKNSEIDKFIRNKERLVELLEEEKQSVIRKAVTKGEDSKFKFKETGIDWIGEIPENWDIKKLKYCSKIIYGISPHENTYNDKGIGSVLINGPVEYSEENFGYTRELKWTNDPKKFAPKESLLFCLRGSTTGRLNICHDDVSIGRGVAAIISETSQDFIIYAIKALVDFISDSFKGSTFPSVTSEDLNNYLIPLPPTIEEQSRIVEFLNKETKMFDLAISKAQKEISSIKEYREALITDLVTGKRSLNCDLE